MITYETKLGSVELSNDYFEKLIGEATSSCFGVAGMAPRGTQKFRNIFSKEHYTEKGVRVIGNADSMDVELHIIVAYGMNISAVAKSITEKVKYVVFENTGITVGKVTVLIDGIKD